MHTNSISKLLNLEGCYVKKVVHADQWVKIYLTTPAKPTQCPHCSQLTSKVHDYRDQTVKDLPLSGKHTFLILKKRRYACSCGKSFAEKYHFLPRYQRMTNRLAMYICSELIKTQSMSDIAEALNISTPTVARVFNHIQYSPPKKLPKVLAIDEFKGNAETGKYQCILVDPVKNRVLDILPDRKQALLIEYFKAIPRAERLKVKFFVCDMWRQYAEIARLFFPNATLIVDKYHFIRQVSWAIESIRKRVQKNMPSDLRRYFKRSRSLILRRADKLTAEDKERLDIMLLYNDDLRQAYYLKELFFDICHMKKYSEQRKAFAEWIEYADNLHLHEFKSCVKAFQNWYKEILAAFKYGYTNGPTEGFNNKIKVLKRVSYGIRNFNRFRNRILHICS